MRLPRGSLDLFVPDAPAPFPADAPDFVSTSPTLLVQLLYTITTQQRNVFVRMQMAGLFEPAARTMQRKRSPSFR